MQHTVINEQSFVEKLYHPFSLFYTDQPLLEMTNMQLIVKIRQYISSTQMTSSNSSAFLTKPDHGVYLPSTLSKHSQVSFSYPEVILACLLKINLRYDLSNEKLQTVLPSMPPHVFAYLLLLVPGRQLI